MLALVAAEGDTKVGIVSVLDRPFADLRRDLPVVLGVEVWVPKLEGVRRVEEDGTRAAPADVLALPEHAVPEYSLPVAARDADATKAILERPEPIDTRRGRDAVQTAVVAEGWKVHALVAAEVRTASGRVGLGGMDAAAGGRSVARDGKIRELSLGIEGDVGVHASPRGRTVELGALVIVRLDAPAPADPLAEPPDPPARDLHVEEVGVRVHALAELDLVHEPLVARVEVAVVDEDALREVVSGLGLEVENFARYARRKRFPRQRKPLRMA